MEKLFHVRCNMALSRSWTGKLFLILAVVGASLGCDDGAPIAQNTQSSEQQQLPEAVLRSAPLSQAQSTDGPLICAAGYSALADSKKAGAQAARDALAQLGDVPAKLVLVFDRGVADPAGMCQGVASVFDSKLVMGCSSHGPISPLGEKATVGVLAIGGKVTVYAVLAPVQGDYHATGRAIGQEIKPAALAATQGRLLMLFGKCHVPMNHRVVLGVQHVLGDDHFPMLGGAAAKRELVYYQGQVYRNGNVGILLTGAFACEFTNKKGTRPEEVVRTAREAGQEMAGTGDPEPAVVLAFSCGARTHALTPDMGEEHAALRGGSTGVPVFGFYSTGEIGLTHTGGQPKGVGLELMVCAIRALSNPDSR